jgi:hypothetical protein
VGYDKSGLGTPRWQLVCDKAIDFVPKAPFLSGLSPRADGGGDWYPKHEQVVQLGNLDRQTGQFSAASERSVELPDMYHALFWLKF